MLDMSRKCGPAILVCSVTMMVSPIVITPAWAQTPAEAPEGQVGLEEIIVTATRRETKLSDTPIALSVVTAQQLNSQRVVNFADLEQAVPSLVFTQVTRQETFFSIRGTGVDNDTPGSDAGVSVFIDGVPSREPPRGLAIWKRQGVHQPVCEGCGEQTRARRLSGLHAVLRHAAGVHGSAKPRLPVTVYPAAHFRRDLYRAVLLRLPQLSDTSKQFRLLSETVTRLTSTGLFQRRKCENLI
jgi:hypothetical protein